MSTVLMTGFPGFLGSALLPRILDRRPGSTALCVVQQHHLATAASRLADLDAQVPGTAARVTLAAGDITVSGLGLGPADLEDALSCTEVFHLAAVYDLAVPERVARAVNVEGTDRVLDLCRRAVDLARLHHVSTCYVSGDHPGRFGEDDLDLGQGFLNHYEATKFESEVLVAAARADGLPVTVYRPGMVVGDSRTGQTQKFDGPYLAAEFIRRQRGIAVLPQVGPPDEVLASLVPRDYVVEAIDALSALPSTVGRTYALTDPEPPTARQYAEIVARHYGRRVVWVPAPLGLTRTVVGLVPGLERLLGLPAEVLDYFATRTRYDTSHAVRDLEGTGVACPRFEDYAATMLDFMAAHPEISSAAMV